MIWSVFVCIGAFLGIIGAILKFIASYLDNKSDTRHITAKNLQILANTVMLQAVGILTLGVIATRIENLLIIASGVLLTLSILTILVAFFIKPQTLCLKIKIAGLGISILGWISLFLAMAVNFTVVFG